MPKSFKMSLFMPPISPMKDGATGKTEWSHYWNSLQGFAYFSIHVHRLKKKGATPHLVHTKLFCDTISMNWRNWVMTKSGNWRGNGWRNGWSLGKQGSCFIVPLKTEGYDPYIDYLKGVSIFFVVLAHCLLI